VCVCVFVHDSVWIFSNVPETFIEHMCHFLQLPVLYQWVCVGVLYLEFLVLRAGPFHPLADVRV
jgi:hypothetical protein